MTGPADAGARVAVVGAGAVGMAIAAWFVAGGHRVTACSPRAPRRQVITADFGDGARRHPVRWCTSPGDIRDRADWVFVATKIHHTAATGDWLDALVGPDTRVVAAQNGVDHRERLAAVTGAPVVPALVYLNAERLEVGSVRVRRTERDLVFPDDPDGRLASSVCATCQIVAHTHPDFTTAAWRKLLTNAAANPLTALTGRRTEVLRDEAVAGLALSLLRETAEVARAHGAVLEDDAPHRTLDWLQRLAPGSTTSMLQDRESGRALESDGLTGTIVRLARQRNIDTPVSDTVLALLGALAPATTVAS